MFDYQAASAQATVLPPLSPPAAFTTPVDVSPLLVGLGTDIFAPGSNQSATGLAGLLNLFSGSSGSAFGTFINSTVGNSIWSSGWFFGIPSGAMQSFGSLLSIGTLGQGQQQPNTCPDNTYPIPQPTPQQWHIPQPSAALGASQSVGNLSVPQSWGRSVPSPSSFNEQPLPLNTEDNGFVGIPGVPLLGGTRERPEPARYGVAIGKVIPSHPSAG
jgi:hypothetical protein